jgi:DNA topoisomerase-2
MSKRTKQTKLNVEDVYKSVSLHQHILAAPDTYIGATASDDVKMFVYNNETNKMNESTINYVSGFYKIFDEILVNARDHTVRDSTCKNIKINISQETGKISVWNDGNGIPIVIHDKHKIYIPEMIFGNLLTSQNYEKKGKTVGGKNGYGAKLTNIYSTEFDIETIGVDKIKEINGNIVPDEDAKKLFYKQTFRNNMYEVNKPDINSKISQKSKTYTQISYLPDYERFGMTGLTDDMYGLILKRCYDIAACTPKHVNIFINDTDIKCREFSDYIKLYYPNEPQIIYEKVNSRWELGIAFDKNIGDRYISFVNGISTFQGGSHVKHVVDSVVKKVTEHINKKREHKSLKIMSSTIKQYLTFFINCTIEDPGFNSQTKEFMNSKIADWCRCGKNCQDVKCDVSDEFITKLCNSGLLTEVVNMSKFKETRDLDKTDGKKVGVLREVDKLIDADWAGSRNSHKASIFLTEGDSAKTFAIAGISVIGNDRYGVFPLKGKVLNVRNASITQIKNNKEFTNIKLILGLKQGVKYTDVSKLRYGSIIILTDQDPDGSHIKGLIINMLEYFWPELLQIEGFIKAYRTPIVKVWKKTDKKKQNIKQFYTITEFEKWERETMHNDTSGWEHKYYKGLGTSTIPEAKESFYNFDDNLITFTCDKKIVCNNQDNDSEKSDYNPKKLDDEYMNSSTHKTIIKAFDTGHAENRKDWLRNFRASDMLEYKQKMSVSYSDFIDKDMIFFSQMDNIRSIPSITDGLKPSQRMILYCCFKRGRKSKETKVAQLSGYVSENTDYHHGEASLQEAIIGLAQNFPGSNNINILEPLGNFGTRRMGGEDSASPRYIFTKLCEITNYIFREEDDEILSYKYNDGKQVEPEFYAPIIPMILINGSKGIGTGFSTTVPPHNPIDIVNNIKRLIEHKRTKKFHPWFNGFRGTIELDETKEKKYIVKGVYRIEGKKVHIEEIPIINGWIEPYETKMDAKITANKDDNAIEAIKKNPGCNLINMIITFKGAELQELYKTDKLDKFLLMDQTLTVTNLHLFNSDNVLSKYDTTQDIINDFYKFRIDIYEKRKAYYIKKLQNDLDICRYKVKFIKEYLKGTLEIARKKVSEVIDQLVEKKYPRLAHDHRALEINKSYRYLTDMSILTLTDDKIKELKDAMEKCQVLFDAYNSLTVEQIWLNELDEFLVIYKKWQQEWSLEIENNDKPEKTNTKKSKKLNV